jgi:signal transduction histidine kinase
MIDKNEREIINLIRYLPVLIVLILSFSITYYLYNENINKFHKEIIKLEEEFINTNKNSIKFQVQNIKKRIEYVKENKEAVLKDLLYSQTNTAYNIINSIYKNNLHKSKEEVIGLIKNALAEIRFNKGRGYYLLVNMKGKILLHPVLKHLENKVLWNYQDKKGVFLLQEVSDNLRKEGESFYNWYSTKAKNEKEYEKLGYFRLFEPFDIVVGAYEFIVDYDEDVKKRLLAELYNYRFSRDGYFFVIRDDGVLLNYHKKEKIGQNIKDLDGVVNPKKFLKELKATIKNDGFLTYIHKDKPSLTKKENKTKTSYIEFVKEWNWFIGSGFYMDDFYKILELKKDKLNIDNKNSTERILIACILITMFNLLLFIYISSMLEKKFISHKKNIKKQIDENIKKDNLLAHQSKMASMGEMIGNIAHQWRQPLSTISTISTGLKMQKELGLKNDVRELEAYTKINEQVQYLSSTIDDFRSFFKPESKTGYFTLNSLIDKTMNLIDSQFQSQDIKIIKGIKSCSMYSLENELVQVLINILNNSRDELEKIEGKRFIFIKTDHTSTSVSIDIYDNAGGIDNSIINRIFEPYFTTKHQKQGTGIGLFMSREIVVKHLSGTINASNIDFHFDGQSYKGAKFTLELSKKL